MAELAVKFGWSALTICVCFLAGYGLVYGCLALLRRIADVLCQLAEHRRQRELARQHARDLADRDEATSTLSWGDPDLATWRTLSEADRPPTMVSEPFPGTLADLQRTCALLHLPPPRPHPSPGREGRMYVVDIYERGFNAEVDLEEHTIIWDKPIPAWFWQVYRAIVADRQEDGNAEAQADRAFAELDVVAHRTMLGLGDGWVPGKPKPVEPPVDETTLPLRRTSRRLLRQDKEDQHGT